MNKLPIDINDYAGDILRALHKGILLSTKAEKFNTMVIGWGTLGTNWEHPVFAAYIREGRFTREQLDANPEFTISVPQGDYDRRIISICGGKSGRDTDKVAEAVSCWWTPRSSACRPSRNSRSRSNVA